MKRLITITYEADEREVRDCEMAVMTAALEELNSAEAVNISIQASEIPSFRSTVLMGEVELPEFMKQRRAKQVTA